MLNYLEYLQRSFIIEESVLLPFLAILKDHLEEFQVFLGKVESWLMESTRKAMFLQETFHVSNLEVDQRVGQQSVLKTMDPQPDRYSQYAIFNISIRNGQEKLAKFLAYVTHIDKNE